MAASTPVSIGDVIRVTYFQTLFEQRILNVFYLRCTVAPTGGVSYFEAVQNLANRLGDDGIAPVQNWLPIVGDELEFDTCRAQRVFPTRDIYASRVMGVDGAHADPATMSNNAMSVEKRTLTFGPQGIGRMQLAGVPASTISAGKFSGSYQVAVQGFADTFLGDITVAVDSSKYRFCLFNGTAPTADDDYFELIVMPDVRTMHRRTLRVGE